MNFYKHHLGDYDAATAHLSWDEDHAYSRMLRAYYRREKPLPADLIEICRLVRAITRNQKAAVERVLGEFFTSGPDGWHNKRADEEIAAYIAQSDTNRRIARSRSRLEPSTNRRATVNESSTIGRPNQIPEPDTRRTAGDVRELISSTALLLKRPARKFD